MCDGRRIGFHRKKRDDGENGLLESRVFPGLRLDAEALLAGDLAAVLGAAREGAEAERHAAFVQQLKSQREA